MNTLNVAINNTKSILSDIFISDISNIICTYHWGPFHSGILSMPIQIELNNLLSNLQIYMPSNENFYPIFKSIKSGMDNWSGKLNTVKNTLIIYEAYSDDVKFICGGYSSIPLIHTKRESQINHVYD